MLGESATVYTLEIEDLSRKKRIISQKPQHFFNR